MHFLCNTMSSYGHRVLPTLSHLQVHSQFDHVINLWDGSTVLTIQDPTVPHTPLSLEVDGDTFGRLRSLLPVGCVVTPVEDGLIWGSHHLDGRGAEFLSCQLHPCPPELPPPDLSFLRGCAQLFARSESLCTVILGQAPPRAGDGRSSMAATAYPFLCDRTPSGLVGLGPGLTPAGDDCLVGILATLRWRGMLDTHHRLCAQLSPKLHHTNAISAAFLRRAMEGEFSQGILQLFHALEHPSQPSLLSSVSALCAVGHTSGSDLLGGVLWTLDPSITEEVQLL